MAGFSVMFNSSVWETYQLQSLHYVNVNTWHGAASKQEAMTSSTCRLKSYCTMSLAWDA